MVGHGGPAAVGVFSSSKSCTRGRATDVEMPARTIARETGFLAAPPASFVAPVGQGRRPRPRYRGRRRGLRPSHGDSTHTAGAAAGGGVALDASHPEMATTVAGHGGMASAPCDVACLRRVHDVGGWPRRGTLRHPGIHGRRHDRCDAEPGGDDELLWGSGRARDRHAGGWGGWGHVSSSQNPPIQGGPVARPAPRRRRRSRAPRTQAPAPRGCRGRPRRPHLSGWGRAAAGV